MRKFSDYLLVAIVVFVIGVGYVANRAVQRGERETREIALRSTLTRTRGAIDQFWGVKGELPHSLDDLVNMKLIDKIPLDPLTNTENWQLVIGTRSDGSKQRSGVVNLHSTSSAISSEGTSYNTW